MPALTRAAEVEGKRKEKLTLGPPRPDQRATKAPHVQPARLQPDKGEPAPPTPTKAGRKRPVGLLGRTPPLQRKKNTPLARPLRLPGQAAGPLQPKHILRSLPQAPLAPRCPFRRAAAEPEDAATRCPVGRKNPLTEEVRLPGRTAQHLGSLVPLSASSFFGKLLMQRDYHA